MISDWMGLIVLPFAARFVTYWTMSAIFAYLDYHYSGIIDEETGQPKLFLEYKIQGKQIIKNGGLDWNKYQQTAMVSLQNFAYNLLFSILTYHLLIWRGLSWNTPFDPIWWILGQLIMVYCLQHALFFYGHYSLHHPYLYSKIHKFHHSWRAPVACRAYYTHPIEHIINDIIPLWLSSLILGIHPIIYCLLLIKTGFETVCTHSGYRFSWCSAIEHDQHHRYFHCNYGGIEFFDWLHGTRIEDHLNFFRKKVSTKKSRGAEHSAQARDGMPLNAAEI